MHIVFVTARYPPYLGGTERQAALLATWLAGRGHRATVLTQAHPRRSPREEAQRVEVVRLAPAAGGRLASLAFDLRLARHLLREARDADLVLAFLASSPALAVRSAARRLGIPAFLRFGASGPLGDAATCGRTAAGRWKLARLRAGFARYLCLNEEIRREFLALGYPTERLVLFPNGVDTDFFSPADPGERERLRAGLGWRGRTVALFMGRLEPQKNLDVLLAAWAGLSRRRPGALLVLAGAGALRPRLERDLGNLAPRGSALLLPEQDAEGVRRLLRAADLFVLPSLTEGMSNALLEAMAAGLAPAASDIPGNRELVAPLGKDLLFDPRDPGDVARVLDALVGDAAACAALGAAARRLALEAHAMDTVGERFLNQARAARGAQPRD